MANAQYTPYPMTDWSSEISGGSAAPQTAASTPSVFQSVPQSQMSPRMSQAAQAQTPQTPQTSQAGGTAAGNGAPASVQTTPQRPFPAPSEFSTGTVPDLMSHQPSEVIEAPATMNEAYLGSLKAMLLRNRGNLVTATFLIGTQGTMAWEGILYEVGNDYIVISQPGRGRYIACDIYALKYIEIYDIRQREMFLDFLRNDGRAGGAV